MASKDSSRRSKRMSMMEEQTDDELSIKIPKLDDLEEGDRKACSSSVSPAVGKIGSRRESSRGLQDKPAELFRKDLISAMKLADTEQLQQDEYVSISDPWRQEWEKGVQVPVNPGETIIKKVEIRKITENANLHGLYAFKFPKKFLHATNDEAYKQGIHELHETQKLADQMCRYDLDDLDAVWLDKMNDEREATGQEPVQEWIMEKVIEEIENQCYNNMQNMIKTVEGLGIEYDENVVCDVCRSPEGEDNNEIVFCDGCDICVHQACYGIQNIPEGSWLCRTCALGIQPKCILCPKSGGAMKSTKSGSKWAHVNCALWIPEVSIGCPEKMEPITKISMIPSSRWSLICNMCRERSGACIQCSVKTCKTAFHVTCAFNENLNMKTILDEAHDDIQLKAYCSKHSKRKEGDITPRKESAAQRKENNILMLEPSTPKKQSEMTEEEKTELRSHRLAKLAEQFFSCVQSDEVADALKMDEETIDFIFSYWVLKRKANFNKPLLMPKTEEADILLKQREDSLIARMKMFIHLRQDLERVRNLCYMVSRREKIRRSLYAMKEEIFYQQMATLRVSEGCHSETREISFISTAHRVPRTVYDEYDNILEKAKILDMRIALEKQMDIAGKSTVESKNSNPPRDAKRRLAFKMKKAASQDNGKHGAVKTDDDILVDVVGTPEHDQDQKSENSGEHRHRLSSAQSKAQARRGRKGKFTKTEGNVRGRGRGRGRPPKRLSHSPEKTELSTEGGNLKQNEVAEDISDQQVSERKSQASMKSEMEKSVSKGQVMKPEPGEVTSGDKSDEDRCGKGRDQPTSDSMHQVDSGQSNNEKEKIIDPPTVEDNSTQKGSEEVNGGDVKIDSDDKDTNRVASCQNTDGDNLANDEQKMTSDSVKILLKEEAGEEKDCEPIRLRLRHSDAAEQNKSSSKRTRHYTVESTGDDSNAAQSRNYENPEVTESVASRKRSGRRKHSMSSTDVSRMIESTSDDSLATNMEDESLNIKSMANLRGSRRASLDFGSKSSSNERSSRHSSESGAKVGSNGATKLPRVEVSVDEASGRISLRLRNHINETESDSSQSPAKLEKPSITEYKRGKSSRRHSLDGHIASLHKTRDKNNKMKSSRRSSSRLHHLGIGGLVSRRQLVMSQEIRDRVHSRLGRHRAGNVSYKNMHNGVVDNKQMGLDKFMTHRRISSSDSLAAGDILTKENLPGNGTLIPVFIDLTKSQKQKSRQSSIMKLPESPSPIPKKLQSEKSRSATGATRRSRKRTELDSCDDQSISVDGDTSFRSSRETSLDRESRSSKKLRIGPVALSRSVDRKLKRFSKCPSSNVSDSEESFDPGIESGSEYAPSDISDSSRVSRRITRHRHDPLLDEASRDSYSSIRSSSRRSLGGSKVQS